jgi:DNA invertase Pin-like site-specific DNA recombinase
VKIGYARVSTQDQKLDLQLKSLKKAGCRKIFREKVSGFNRQRPEFQRMLDQIRPAVCTLCGAVLFAVFAATSGRSSKRRGKAS